VTGWADQSCFKRYPIPQTVSMRLGDPGDCRSFRRTFDICVSTVLSSTVTASPQTSPNNSSRRNTRPGSDASRQSSANSVGVRLIFRTPSLTSCRSLSIVSGPITARVLSLTDVRAPIMRSPSWFLHMCVVHHTRHVLSNNDESVNLLLRWGLRLALLHSEVAESRTAAGTTSNIRRSASGLKT